MTRPARLLIVSSGHLCCNPRPVKEAFTLGNAGHAVTLLTPLTDLRLSVLDASLSKNAPFTHTCIPHRHSFALRLHQWLARRSVPAGVHSIHALGDASELLAAARNISADLTIVHNEVPHWIGTRLLAEGRRVAADIEDWHSEDLRPEDRRHRPLRLLQKTEHTLLHQAAYTSTTSLALAEALHARYGGQRPHVITNSFPLQPAHVRSAPGMPPSFFWFSQTLGPSRGLEAFLAAWSLAKAPSRLVLLGEPCHGYKERLLALVPTDFRARIEFLPLVPPDELPAIIARHDIGLALEDASIRNRDLTITNKILQYLNAGLAIVASDTAGQREVLNRSPEAGFIAATADEPTFAAQLDQLLKDSARLHASQRAARQLAEDCYCWEREAPRLIELVESSLR